MFSLLKSCHHLGSSGCCCFTQMTAVMFLSQHLVPLFRNDRQQHPFGAQQVGNAEII